MYCILVAGACVLGTAEERGGLADAVAHLIVGNQEDVGIACAGGCKVLMLAGLLAYGQVQGHRAAYLHPRLF